MKSLLSPFLCWTVLGDNIYLTPGELRAREEGEFTLKTELRKRGGLSSTLVEKMDDMGILGNMPEDDQLRLFDEFSKIIQSDFKLSMKRGLKANLLEEVDFPDVLFNQWSSSAKFVSGSG